MTKPRKADPRRIKIHRSYTVDEAARLLDLSKATIRRWIKSGLPVIDDRKPLLILGADLRDFIPRRRETKQRCRPYECYCVKCRAPRVPAEDMADFVPMTRTSGMLRGLCPVCTTLMHKRMNVAALEALKPFLDVTVVKADEPIADCPAPSVDEHLR